MRLLTARVLNYKSFSDSGVVALSGGFNVILGRNDAGKSAFLEALSLRMTSKPHRSLETVPDRQWPVDSLSTVHLSLSVSKAELVAILSRHETIFVPVFDGSTAEQTQRLFETVVDDPGTFHGVWSNGSFQRGAFDRFGEIRSVVQSVVVTNTKQPRAFAPRFGVISNASPPTYADILAAALPERIFLFRAERLSVGEHLATGNHVLTPNASNLAEAINSLQTSNPPLFEAYLGHVKSVFPHITQITAPIIPGTTSLARIMVWGVPVDSTRDDLAIPLNESGTGIGQVLAMLYVAVTSHSATTILIDEPHSFLHPGAVKTLFGILRRYPQHQFVLATHSTIAVGRTESTSIYHIQRDASASRITSVDASRSEELRAILTDVGASLSDVYSAERVLWVEGRTEAVCFPILVEKFALSPSEGLQILPVSATGDLEGKHALRIFAIYEALRRGNTLLPASVFVLDPDAKSKSVLDRIDRTSSGLVKWLPRRMYENFLLQSDAIATVLSGEDPNRAAPLTSSDVLEWLAANASSVKYFGRDIPLPDHNTIEFSRYVDGAQLLDDLFSSLSECRVAYDKVRHGRQLTLILADTYPAECQEIVAFISSILRS